MAADDTTGAQQEHHRVAETAAIIGCGLIGGSLGLVLKARQAVERVIAVARTEQTLSQARALGAADETTRDVAAAVAEADLVVLATPVLTIISQLRAIAPHLRPGCLVTDVGSTKLQICRAARERFPASADFVGGHPMAGSEQTGIAAARVDLFERAIWVLTPTEDVRPEALDRAQQLVAASGARPLVLSPEDHDQFAAVVSHVPHLLAAAITTRVGELASERPEIALMAAGGFRDMTRVAAGNADLWRDILATNQSAAVKQIDAVIEGLQNVVEMLGAGDMAGLREFLDRARQLRRHLGEQGRTGRGE